MTQFMGLDIGGTKIAGAMFDEAGVELAQVSLPTPKTYEAFLETCRAVVQELEKNTEKPKSIGVGICGPFDRTTGIMKIVSNISYLSQKPLRADLGRVLGRKVHLENDAACAALAEAMEGAGKGHASVFGLILGTGVGGGFIFNGHVVAGANGLCGEIGHMPLPYAEESDGKRIVCGCGQIGCIETYISGPALARLYDLKREKEPMPNKSEIWRGRAIPELSAFSINITRLSPRRWSLFCTASIPT
jgi:fructokinase